MLALTSAVAVIDEDMSSKVIDIVARAAGTGS